MKQLLQSEFNKGGKIYKNISSPETSGTQTQITNIVLDGGVLKLSTDNGTTFVLAVTQQGNDLQNNTIKISNSIYGFAAGGNNATATTGGAVGSGANATTGGAVGTASKETDGGGAVGSGATATTGGAVGTASKETNGGGAVGNSANAGHGGAVGNGATATYGGAIGNGAATGTGGAVGAYATATYGGAVGQSATATYGGAVGNGATATSGGAIGNGATAGDGFSGGFNAQVVKDSDGKDIDAIQLGEGTNNTPKTLQVYNYKVYDSTKDSLYCQLLNDKTPTVIETVWSGTLANDGSTTITVSTYRQYDYFILYGSTYGPFGNIIPNKNGTYGFTKKSEADSDIFAYSFVYTDGSFTWGESGYYANGNFTFVDRTGTSSYVLYKIEGVKICKA